MAAAAAAAAAPGAAVTLSEAELFWEYFCKWGSVSLFMAFSGCGQFLVHRNSTILTRTLCGAEFVHTCVGLLGLDFFLAVLSYHSNFGLQLCCSNSSVLQQIICFICFSNVLVFFFS